MEIGDCKCQIATLRFETDKKLLAYKKYVKNLQNKLESHGFKFKDQRRKKIMINQKLYYNNVDL